MDLNDGLIIIDGIEIFPTMSEWSQWYILSQKRNSFSKSRSDLCCSYSWVMDVLIQAG